MGRRRRATETHCANGHLWVEADGRDNCYVDPDDGVWRCRRCNAEHQQAFRLRERKRHYRRHTMPASVRF